MRVVTIDGPAGAGKSTVSRRLADLLGWRLLDTGAMYRTVALAAWRFGVDPADDAALGELARSLRVRFEGSVVLLDGEDVSREIRSVEVTKRTGRAADSRSVRACLAGWQRRLAAEAAEGVVTEGRDQGTIVFPDALCKFFLTASTAERARRRHAEYLARGETVAYEVILEAVETRDLEDEARAIAPLKAADDAVTLDTGGLSLDDVTDRLFSEVRRRLGTLADVRS